MVEEKQKPIEFTHNYIHMVTDCVKGPFLLKYTLLLSIIKLILYCVTPS